MKLVLKNFRQDVDVSDPSKAKNALVFEDDESGRELVVPVQFESVAAIAKFISGENESGADLDEPEPDDFAPVLDGPVEIHPDVEDGADEFPPRPELAEPEFEGEEGVPQL